LCFLSRLFNSACFPGDIYTAFSLLTFSKHSPKVLTMSFSHAKAKSLREASLRRGDIASPSEGLAPVGTGVSGGEEVRRSGDPGGGVGFPDARRQRRINGG
jgi:hypothetical protein